MAPVSITDATKVYEGGVEALRGVSLDCAAGRVTALLGRSGCGKTTLLNLCGAMDFPTTGDVSLAGQRTTTLSDAELTALRRHKIGFVFQFFQLLPSLTVLENIELPLLLSGGKNTESTALERLRWVDLEEKSRSLPYQLSGGQMQRVAIARSLAHNPAILVADEPTGNLDTASAAPTITSRTEECAKARIKNAGTVDPIPQTITALAPKRPVSGPLRAPHRNIRPDIGNR